MFCLQKNQNPRESCNALLEEHDYAMSDETFNTIRQHSSY
uniref:Uncharacterized protein n=1 Tax=Arundo donax TaxID=35708 RepID=A0A0A9HPH3_ARUDO